MVCASTSRQQHSKKLRAACGRSVDLGDIRGNVWNEEANDGVPWKENEGKGANENADRERRQGEERKKEKLEEGGRV